VGGETVICNEDEVVDPDEVTGTEIETRFGLWVRRRWEKQRCLDFATGWMFTGRVVRKGRYAPCRAKTVSAGAQILVKTNGMDQRQEQKTGESEKDFIHQGTNRSILLYSSLLYTEYQQ
jgi:hypothetical protein